MYSAFDTEDGGTDIKALFSGHHYVWNLMQINVLHEFPSLINVIMQEGDLGILMRNVHQYPLQ